MAQRCDYCRSTQVCVPCTCKSPALALCEVCLAKHITSTPGTHCQVNQLSIPDQYYCSTCDTGLASYFCLCNKYVCALCIPSHHPPDDKHHVFPLNLMPIYHKDYTGKLLTQGELIDITVDHLETEIKTGKRRMIQHVASVFDKLEAHLQAEREKTLSDVIKYAREFEWEMKCAVERLKEMKYQENWVPNCELESLIQQEVNICSQILAWEFDMEEYKRKWKSLSRVKPWKYLLKEVEKEGSRFVVVNGKTQVFELPTLKRVEVSEELAWLEGSMLCLPSTEWFFSETKTCYLLSPEITTKTVICKLQEKRSLPGLSHYRNNVYLFGGNHSRGVSYTVECVDLDSRTSRLLARAMPSSFSYTVPCRHGDKLYFGSSNASEFSLVFNLQTELFEKSAISYSTNDSSVSLALPYSEIVVLANHGVYSHTCEATESYPLSEGSSLLYLSGTVPVRYQGVWYFMARDESNQMIYTLDERSKDIQQVLVLERGPNILEKLMRGKMLSLPGSHL